MNQPTLFLSPRYSPDSRLMRDAASAKNWQVERMGTWAIPETEPSGPIVLYGETLFCRYLADHFDITLVDPGDDFLQLLPMELRKRKIRCTTAAAARFIDVRVFIKPVNDKTFGAAVFESGKDLPATIINTEIVLIAEPVVFTCEFRFFVHEGKARTGSLYSRYGVLTEEGFTPEEFDAALQMAEAAAPFLPGAMVIDTGHIEGRGWAVIEANPAWASGLYACDPAEALEVIKASCINRL